MAAYFSYTNNCLDLCRYQIIVANSEVYRNWTEIGGALRLAYSGFHGCDGASKSQKTKGDIQRSSESKGASQTIQNHRYTCSIEYSLEFVFVDLVLFP